MSDATKMQGKIDSALRALAQPPVPEGLEARVASRLRERQREMAERGAGRPAGLVWVGAGVCAAVLLVAAVGMLRSHPATVAAVRSAKSAAVARPVTLSATQTPAKVQRALSRRRRQDVEAPKSMPEAVANLHTPPPLPLTQQERLLLALAHSPGLLPQLGAIVHSETVSDHGVGQNTIFELEPQELKRIPNALPGDLE